MGPGYRRGFTAAEKTDLWDRWQRGESLNSIGRAFGKASSSIYFQLSPHGGIRPAALTADAVADRARDDIAWSCGRSIGPFYGQVAGPRAVDGEPGDKAEWRL